jgi:hypothetical protein
MILESLESPMSFLRILPAQFSLLLLAALFMRLGFPLIMIAPMTLMLLLALLVPWAQVRALMTVPIALNAVLWTFVAYGRVQERIAEGQPWMRLAAILFGVAAFTAWAAWLVWDSRRFDVAPAESQAEA